LAELYRAQANYAAAEPLFLKALKIREKGLGPNHPDTAVSLNNLALMYLSQRDYTSAAPLFGRALEIREMALGPDNPRTAQSLYNLGSLEWLRGHSEIATALVARSIAIDLGHRERTAAIQTEQQQFKMTQEADHYLWGWLTVTTAERQSAESCWRYALLWKGLTTRRQLELKRTLKEDPNVAALAGTRTLQGSGHTQLLAGLKESLGVILPRLLVEVRRKKPTRFVRQEGIHANSFLAQEVAPNDGVAHGEELPRLLIDLLSILRAALIDGLPILYGRG
jgi:tetratricopeptide (TPR) repeat protein